MLPIPSSPYRQTASFNPPLNYSPAQVLPTMASTRMHTGFPVPMNTHQIPTNIQYHIAHHQPQLNPIPQQSFQLPKPQIATIPTFQHNGVQNVAIPPLQRTETRVNYVPQKKQVTTMVDQEIQEVVPKERTIVEYIPVQTIIEKVPQPVEVPYEVKVPVPVQVPYYVYPNGQTQMIEQNTQQFPQQQQYTQQYTNYPQQQQMITQQQPIQQQIYQQPMQQQQYQTQPQQYQQIYNVQQPIMTTELQKSIDIQPSQQKMQQIQQMQQPQGFQQFNQYPQQQQQYQQIPQQQFQYQYPQQFMRNGSPNRPEVLPYAMETKDDSYESDSDIYESDSDGGWDQKKGYKGGKGYWEDFQNSTGYNKSYGNGRNSSSGRRYDDNNNRSGYQGNNQWNDYEGRRNMGRFGARGQQQNYNQNQLGQRRLNRGDYYDQSKQRNI